MHKIDYISQTSVILMAAKFFCEIYSAKIKCVRVATVLGQQNTWTFVRPWNTFSRPISRSILPRYVRRFWLCTVAVFTSRSWWFWRTEFQGLSRPSFIKFQNVLYSVWLSRTFQVLENGKILRTHKYYLWPPWCRLIHVLISIGQVFLLFCVEIMSIENCSLVFISSYCIKTNLI